MNPRLGKPDSSPVGDTGEMIPFNAHRLRQAWLNFTTDSLSDFETSRTRQNEDTEQQFWGDNEQESSSLSDDELITTNIVSVIKPNTSSIPETVPEPDSGPSHGFQERKRKRIKHHEHDTSDNSMQENLIEGCVPRKQKRHLYGNCVDRYRTLHGKYAQDLQQSSTDSDSNSSSSSNRDPELLRTYQGSELNVTGQSLHRKLCSRCKIRPTDGIILHGDLGHQCFCYQCALKLWRTRTACPICKRKIRTVMKTNPNFTQQNEIV